MFIASAPGQSSVDQITWRSCDSRFKRACVCVFKVITLAWDNQGNYFQNANACNKFMLKMTVATQLIWPSKNLILPPTLKKYTISSKINNFFPNKQIWPNKLIKLKQANHDNTQFVGV